MTGMSPLKKLFVLGTAVTFLLNFLAQHYYLRYFSKSIQSLRTEDDAKVSLSVYSNFKQVARLALPTWRCREAAGSALFIVLFAVKAILRVAISKANGIVLATMLHGKPSERLYRFVSALLVRGATGLCAGMCSGAIEGLRSWLIACYRERLSRLFQRRFYTQLVYYQATVLDDRLDAADTTIATYCGEFAEHFAELPYYFVLPGLECITSASALVQQSGFRAASLMGVIVTTSVLLLRKLSPQFGRIHAQLLSRDDDYRRMLTNDLNNVENIAMHDAGSYTLRKLDASLAKLKFTLTHMALAKGNFEMIELAFTTFLSIAADAVTFSNSRRSNFRRSVDDIYLEIQLIEGLNDSVKDFVVNFRELSHLSEFTNKLADFDRTLTSIAAGTFVHDRGMSGSSSQEAPMGRSRRYSKVQYIATSKDAAGVCDFVRMKEVELRSPAGQVLFANMTLNFRSDEDWVIVGENGSGKTSLLRMLCGLWPPTTGVFAVNESVHFLLAPQQPYMAPQCTLFEQICFPNTTPGTTDEVRANVREAIRLAGAHTVLQVIGGVDSPVMGFGAETDDTYDWGSLSGGQMQRISMTRVFYHVLSMDRSKATPVAILDEATSMMDETEQDVINNLQRMNVRMISVTHRNVVIRHHTNMLRIAKGGKWRTERVTSQVPTGELVETADSTV